MEAYDASAPPGNYENLEVLGRKINAAIISLEKREPVRFIYKNMCKKITINFASDTMLTASLLMTRSFAELLSFNLTEQESLLDPNYDESHKMIMTEVRCGEIGMITDSLN